MDRPTVVKILEYESRRGFDDRAVAGGLRALAERIERDRTLQQDGVPTQELALLLREYSTLPLSLRQKCLQEALKLLANDPKSDAVVPEGRTSVSIHEDLGVGPSTDRLPEELLRSVAILPGISTATVRKLKGIGIETIWDLLNYYPRRYDDFSAIVSTRDVKPGRLQTVVGQVSEIETRVARSGIEVTTAVIVDDVGSIDAVWFNQPYLERALRRGMRVAISGEVTSFGGKWTMQTPEWEPVSRSMLNTGRIVPVYALVSGLSVRTLRRLIWHALDTFVSLVPDPLPDAFRHRHGLPEIQWCLRQVHFPDSTDNLRQARRRLAFEELLVLQLALMTQKYRWQHELPARPVMADRTLIQRAIDGLAFQLTGAQLRCLEEVLADMGRRVAMNRLLQGDVGSGKTVVAALAMLAATLAGFQSALMAPTEVLAEQHLRTLTELFHATAAASDLLSPRVALLKGSMSRRDKDAVLRSVQEGTIDVLVGTHALIQSEVEFKDLNLVVIDEQHRFGVVQRANLRQKGYNPHVLVMTATPIPRTLALTIYKELDISVIDEMPPGRRRVITRVFSREEREAGYNLIRSEIKKGRQAYVICPLIEESSKLQVRAAVAEYERLREEIFPEFRIGLLHGRMSSKEKDAVMQAFRHGELDILVSTAVIEVGIDVPNATVIAIEGADRFGLAQLHQFRGRVGRGTHQSFCLLFSDAEAAYNDRLRVIESVYDGFQLAEEDLKLRGPGEFLGFRQSGMPELKIADISDMGLLREVGQAADELFGDGRSLDRPALKLLRRRVLAMISPEVDLS